MPTALQSTAVGWLLISLGHTLSAKDWQSLPQARTLPNLAYTCARAGWFQGSGFFLMNALINYSWSQNPALLNDPINRAVAALMTAIVGVSSGWYLKRGVKSNGIVVALMGALQAWAAFGN
ncbi:hypothetical protein BDV32DRAFT_146014 [Aspergillus pseudonomiae]|uniref:Integral membrane protein n=2 Tax=Aspergillus subgen. Circumdati TaxID=2720871 RepID=A0A0L1J0B5_ASPN3|nr:uncharacterized protein ANOM_007147 [Aspergillus nomiae NRRL 13137]XP_031942866.1 uncharacterized protein BDV37DRAFT_281681 [Aspergillus pseudonomiae]KAB8264232.1 hypothetical protein BDV32DRAFT_146014 [Aspergillus pseudonomiae]KAE8405547.1 hypothetical protein BDV37DRAFT_281681 [Aspergillus pseudonomiae]KNG85187.1 hypothetical protein ANOM_007147 [Aspergillus nomiae NRRL 13137]